MWARVAVPVAVVALGAAFLVPGLIPSAGERDLNSGSATDPANWGIYVPAGPLNDYSPDVAGFAPGPAVDDGALAAVDPREFYWAMLTRQGTRPVTDVAVNWWPDRGEYDAQFPGNQRTAERVAVDWRSRAFLDENFTVKADGTADTEEYLSRCLSRDQYAVFYPAEPVFELPDRWTVNSTADGLAGKVCVEKLIPEKFFSNQYVTDGVAPAGLTPEKMDAFISYLDGIPGLIDVARPTAVTGHDGKQYIQLDVTLVPQDSQALSEQLTGAGFLFAAFGQTGEDPFAYPYSPIADKKQGFHVRYFVDPETLLPAYSVVRSDIPLLMDGTIDTSDADAELFTSFEYSWPDQLDPDGLKTEGVPAYPWRPWPFDKVDFPA